MKSNRATLWVNVTIADRARIKRFLGPEQSPFDWLRSLMSDSLEEGGEAPLETLPTQARQKNSEPGVVPHGTVSGYIHHHCRCDRCREACKKYHAGRPKPKRRKKAA